MDATPETKIGKYEILRVLGRGGMGEVLLAQDLDLGRKVAIKRPFKSALQEGLARFQVEARAATLNHRNIPAVYELGVQDGLPFIAMEYVEGQPLDQIIASHAELDLITKLSIIEQVCSALGYAHQKGIIHRDIKPANVIVQPDGVVKIIDFGIAKVQSKDGANGLTQASLIIGSLHYIAPERFKGETIDGRADIFSTGVMLYLLLTGSLPFPGAEATAAYKIVNEGHIALASHLHDYPPALDQIMDRALAKSPAQRYSTAEDFADALHEVIEELKRNRVGQLYGDAERLSTERKFEPALELLNQAINLDPANTQVRRLRKFVREQQDKINREESRNSCMERAEQALATENVEEALSLLKEAIDCDPTYPGLKDRIQRLEEKKRLNERTALALSHAEAIRGRDVTGAMRFVEKALAEDPGNFTLLTARDALAKQADAEIQNAKTRDIFEAAKRELAARHFTAVEELLEQARKIDPVHPETDRIRTEMARIKEADERRPVLDEIQRRVYEFVQADNYAQANELIARALDKLPAEPVLLRLKVEVEDRAHSFEAKRSVDQAIERARELAKTSPAEALAEIQAALEQVPNESRLLEYEGSLRQQSGQIESQQRFQDTIRSARDLVDSRQFDQAIAVLEAFQLRYGARPEVEEFLNSVREQSATQIHRASIERCIAESRAHVRAERFDEAAHCLEAGVQTTGDPVLIRLLAEVRESQQSALRKVDALVERASQMRAMGHDDEAIDLLHQRLAAAPGDARAQQMLSAIHHDLEEKQVLDHAIASARLAAQQNDFDNALKSLDIVNESRGKRDGPTSDLGRAIDEITQARTAHAQAAVGRAIAGAQSALAQKDPAGALKALTAAATLVPFADARRQADWHTADNAARSLISSTKAAGDKPADNKADANKASFSTAQSGNRSGTAPPPPPVTPSVDGWSTVPNTGGNGPVLQAGLGANATSTPPPPPLHLPVVPPTGPTVKPSSTPGNKSGANLVWVIAAVALLLIAGGAFAWWKLRPHPPALAHVKMSNVPAGATVTIDHGAAQIVDASGHFKSEVQPGDRLIEVSKPGYEPFSEEVPFRAGETVNYSSISLKKISPAIDSTGNSTNTATSSPGRLVPSGDLPEFKVSVDGVDRGLLHQGDVIAIEPGSHNIIYSAPDNSSTVAHTVTIAANADLADNFSLKSAAVVKQTKLTIRTTPRAHILIDGQIKASANSDGAYSTAALAPGMHLVDISLDGFQSVTSRPVVVTAGGNASLNQPLAPKSTSSDTARDTAKPPPTQSNSGDADIEQIRRAHDRFEAAYGSKNIAQLKSEWLDIGPQRATQMEDIYKKADIVVIHEKCNGEPTIAGAGAEWRCTEIVQLNKNFFGPSPKTLRFSKVGAKWILRDK